MDEARATTTRFRRLPVITLLGVAVLAAAWTGIWATARGRILAEIDGRMAQLAERGIVVACADRAIGGFPFRMELSCAQPGVAIAARGVRASAAAMRVVAQVWDPRLILVELDGPGVSADGGGEVAATWRTLRASLRWTTEGPQRVSLSADGLDLTARPIGRPALHLVAAHVEAHGRPSGTSGHDLDLALSFAAAGLDIAGKRLGPPTADLTLATTLVDFLPPGPGGAAQAFAGRGGRAEPTQLSLAVGGMTIEGNGKLVLDGAGEIDGMITLVARGFESLIGGGAGKLGPELTAVVGGFAVMGKPSGDPARPGRRLELIVDHGLVRIARLTLGHLPPLFAPGS